MFEEGQDEIAAYHVKLVGTKYVVVDAQDRIATMPDGTPASDFVEAGDAKQIAAELNALEEEHEGTPEVAGLFDAYDADDGDQDSDDWGEDD